MQWMDGSMKEERYHGIDVIGVVHSWNSFDVRWQQRWTICGMLLLNFKKRSRSVFLVNDTKIHHRPPTKGTDHDDQDAEDDEQ
jgi:hypothetical protein